MATTINLNFTIPKCISDILPNSKQINEIEKNLAEFIEVTLPDVMDQGLALLAKNHISLTKAVCLSIAAPIAIILAIKMAVTIINVVLTMVITLAFSVAAGYLIFQAIGGMFNKTAGSAPEVTQPQNTPTAPVTEKGFVLVTNPKA